MGSLRKIIANRAAAHRYLYNLHEKRKKQATEVVSQPANYLSACRLTAETRVAVAQSRVSAHLLPSAANLPTKEHH